MCLIFPVWSVAGKHTLTVVICYIFGVARWYVTFWRIGCDFPDDRSGGLLSPRHCFAPKIFAGFQKQYHNIQWRQCNDEVVYNVNGRSLIKTIRSLFSVFLFLWFFIIAKLRLALHFSFFWFLLVFIQPENILKYVCFYYITYYTYFIWVQYPCSWNNIPIFFLL